MVQVFREYRSMGMILLSHCGASKGVSVSSKMRKDDYGIKISEGKKGDGNISDFKEKL